MYAFMDDVTFGRNGRDAETWRPHKHRGVAIPGRSLMSMNASLKTHSHCVSHIQNADDFQHNSRHAVCCSLHRLEEHSERCLSAAVVNNHYTVIR